MLSKTLQISFKIAMIIAFFIGGFRLADKFIYYKENKGFLPFLSVILYLAAVVFLYMIFKQLSKIFRNVSRKEYFSKPAIRTLKTLGIYAIFFQVVLIIYKVWFDQPQGSIALGSLPPEIASIFHYVELVFTYGTFLLLGLGMIAFSKVLERGRWLEHHESMVH